jgi:NAD(P)-dependent dehydrogenase (short-subunit alcohol dehydrogenase family)
MATIGITGSAGGIGRATRERLEATGHDVIGVDVRDAEVIADLATPEGRAAMVAEVERVSGGRLDGLVAGAGVMDGPDGGVVVATNYFGAIATLTGLRPLLQRGDQPSAVAISSNSITTQPGLVDDLVDACLAGDERAALAAASGRAGLSCYPAAKLALARWVRRHARTAEWAGAGIRLNAVAPGLIATPMTEAAMEFILGLGEVFPIPLGRPGQPGEVAGLLAYLLSAEASFFCGSVVFMDGGTDAALRGDDWPAPLGPTTPKP